MRIKRDYWNCNHCGTTNIAGNIYTCPNCNKTRGEDEVFRIAPHSDNSYRNNKLHSEHANAIVPVPDIIPDDDIAIPNTVADFIGDYDSDDNYWNNFSNAISDLPWRGIGGIIMAFILAIAYIISS